MQGSSTIVGAGAKSLTSAEGLIDRVVPGKIHGFLGPWINEARERSITVQNYTAGQYCTEVCHVLFLRLELLHKSIRGEPGASQPDHARAGVRGTRMATEDLRLNSRVLFLYMSNLCLSVIDES